MPLIKDLNKYGYLNNIEKGTIQDIYNFKPESKKEERHERINFYSQLN